MKEKKITIKDRILLGGNGLGFFGVVAAVLVALVIFSELG